MNNPIHFCYPKNSILLIFPEVIRLNKDSPITTADCAASISDLLTNWPSAPKKYII